MSEHPISKDAGYRTARILHAVTAAVFMVLLLTTSIAVEWASNSSERDLVHYWHMSFGVLFLYLLTFRYFGALVLPTTRIHFDSRWQAIMARSNHWFLYTLMLVVPTTGLFFTLAEGDSVPFFDIFIIQPGEWIINEDIGFYLSEVHIWLQWPCYVLLGAHTVGAVSHWAKGKLKERKAAAAGINSSHL